MPSPAPVAAPLELRELILPVHSNHHGNLFAGQGLQMLAKAAFLAGRHRAGRECVMAAVSGVDFLAPVTIGQELVLRATVSRVGRSSMTVKVDGVAGRPGSEPVPALKAVFEMVAVDDDGRPCLIERSPSENEKPA